MIVLDVGEGGLAHVPQGHQAPGGGHLFSGFHQRIPLLQQGGGPVGGLKAIGVGIDAQFFQAGKFVEADFPLAVLILVVIHNWGGGNSVLTIWRRIRATAAPGRSVSRPVRCFLLMTPRAAKGNDAETADGTPAERCHLCSGRVKRGLGFFLRTPPRSHPFLRLPPHD